MAEVKSTFSKQNYILLIAGSVFIGAGYLLMAGGGSDDPNVFNYDIFSFRRITLAPLVCLAGFILILFGIMRRPR